MMRGMVPYALLLVAVLVSIVDAQLTSHFNHGDLSKLVEKANGVLAAPKSLQGAYYAARALRSSGHNSFTCNCKGLQDILSASGSAYDAFYAIKLEEDCRCHFKQPVDVDALASKEMAAGNLKSLAGGVLAASARRELTAEEKSNAMSKMTNLMTQDGTFKMNADDEEGTTGNVHYALEILAAVAGGNAGSDLAPDVFEKAFQLLPGGDYHGETDATLVVPLSKLIDKKLRLVGDRLNAVAEALLNKKHSGCMTCVSRVYDGLMLVAQYKASPLQVSFSENRFYAESPQNHKLQLVVKSILGEDVPLESAEVVSVKTVGKDSAHFAGQHFENGVLDMSSSNLGPGRYLAQVSVTAAGRTKPLTHQAYFVVADSVAVRDVRFHLVSGSDDGAKSEPHKVTTQNGLRADTASAMAGDSVRISFQVASNNDGAVTRKPHQAVVRLTHHEGRSVVFTAKKVDAGAALNYEAKFSVADSIQKFDYKSGTYVVTIQVGDAAYAEPVEWVVGTVDLALPTKKSEHLPLYAKSLLHSSDVALEPLPEIEHVMRPPAKRASNFMATVFTALTAAPLVVFVVYVLSLRPDLSRLASLPSIAALVCLALLLGLYVSYWLALPGVNFYETIRYLCILTPITMIVGSFALSAVKARRTKDTVVVKDKQA